VKLNWWRSVEEEEMGFTTDYCHSKGFREIIVGSRPKWERKCARRRMTTGRAIVGKKACKRKEITGKKHRTRACK
jgi:hypothetical protein